jgi:hypothetical protein
MAARFGVPHAFYEMNNGTSGRHRAIREGIEVFRRAVEVLLRA